MLAPEIIGFVNNGLFPALKELDASASPQHKVIRSVFEDANNYMKSGTQLLAVIERLEEAIHFDDFKSRAQLGDVHEQLLNDLRKAVGSAVDYLSATIAELQQAAELSSNQQIIAFLENASTHQREVADTLDLQARDAQAAGDRLYWPIYNLDQSNKYAPEEESHDPDVLLEKYKALLGQIEETENRLKSELAAALAHHFSTEAAEE